MNIQGSYILITGGNAWIGKVATKILSEVGAKALITGRDEKKPQNVAHKLSVLFVAADVLNKQPGNLDVLISNIGISEFSTLEKLMLEAFQKVYNVNIFGLALQKTKRCPWIPKVLSKNWQWLQPICGWPNNHGFWHRPTKASPYTILFTELSQVKNWHL